MSGVRTTRPSDRIRVRRNPKKGRYERERIVSILDRGLVGHVAFIDGGEPVCIPFLYARLESDIYIHGSRASRAMRLLASGVPVCFTVTLLDGLVLARSAFEHSANYESVVAFGRAGDDERLRTLAAFTDKLLPGRWAEIRHPSAKELKAVAVLAMTIADVSAKVRTGPPDDDGTEDSTLDVWAGELPLSNEFLEPLPSPGLRPGLQLRISLRRRTPPADDDA
jgi:uncharacterized protein